MSNGGSSVRLPRRVGLGVLAAVGLCLAPVADAAKKPDLRVSALANPPAAVDEGAKLSLKVTVANAGNKSAKASSTRVYLGWDEALAFGKVGSLGALKTPKLGAGKKKKAKAKLKVPEGLPTGELRLVACADDTSKVSEVNEDDNCRAAASGLEVTAPLDAIGLIQAEYEQGDITLDEGALYLAYAASEDPRLPERFGDVAETFDSDALRRVAANWNGLTAQTQAKLDPFFSPPIYREEGPGKSRARRGPLPAPGCTPGAGQPPAPSPDWTFIDTTHFRIWHPVDSDAGASAVAAVAEHVYNQETALWRVPLSDGAQACNGGNGHTDVYMTGLGGAKAQVIPFPPGNSFRPSWMWINPGSFSGNGLRDAFAHEFAHVVQLSYNYAVASPAGFPNQEYGWLEEATATWAIDYVYAGDNYEFEFADDYYAGDAWDTPLGECRRFGCGNGYRDYLYFFYLSNKLGDATLTEVLANTEAVGSIPSVNAAAAFEDEWAKFALHNLNRGDYNDYGLWDPGFSNKLSIDDGSEQPHLDVKLNGKSSVKTSLPDGDEVIPKEYEWLSFSFEDDDVRKIELRDFGWDTSPAPPAEAKVTAWYELANGDFVTEDWTEEDEKTFCRDKEEEDLVRLVLFYSNGKPTPFLADTDYADHPKSNAEIEALDFCEWPKYTGTFTGSANYTDDQIGGTLNTNWNGSLGIDPNTPEDPNYKVVSGSLTFTFSGRIDDCDVAGNTSVALPTFDMAFPNVMTIYPGEGDDPDTYQLAIQMPMAELAEGTRSNCQEPSQNGQSFDFPLAAGAPAMVASSDPFAGFNPIPVPSDQVLSGSASAPAHGGTPATNWTWNLNPVP